MCSWVLRVAQGAVGERDVDTIGVGRVRVEGDQRVPYILPLARGGSQVGGRVQPRPNLCVCEGGGGGGERSLQGSGPWERAGVGRG